MISVAVVMSTYNGEKYLREQLDSILDQKNVDLHLYVRDDGSSDSTKDILSEYKACHANVHLDFAHNVGVGNSFMELLYSVPDTFDYYAFADQDDTWDRRKIIEAVDLLQESNKLLYASNQQCVDKEGEPLTLRYREDEDMHLTPVSIINKNMLAGCTMVLTNELNKILCSQNKRPSSLLLKNRMHDVWIAMVASLYNGIIYDKRSFINYRQHENNVVGANYSFSKKAKDKFEKLRHAEYRNGRSLLAKEIVEKFPDAVQNYPLIKVCANSRTFKGKIELIRYKNELIRYSGESNFSIFFKVIAGLY